VPTSRFPHKLLVCRPEGGMGGELGHQRDTIKQKTKRSPWPESASELYRPSDRRLSAKLVTTFARRGSHVVSVTDTYGRNLVL
jgi:hypothetical protein